MSDYASGQPSKRGYSTFRDQHGRKWGCTTENKTRHPVGCPEPKFKAPILPPVHLIRMRPGDDTELVIHYVEWLREIDGAMEEWNQRLREAAKKLYGQGAIATAIENPQRELLDEVGPRPKTDRREFVEAASQSNKWALGLTDQVPTWAQAILAEMAEEKGPREKSGAPVRQYPDAENEKPEYPIHQGYGRWLLSDGTLFRGKAEEAKERQAALLQEA